MLNYNVLDTNEYYVRGCLFKSYEYASHLTIMCWIRTSIMYVVVSLNHTNMHHICIFMNWKNVFTDAALVPTSH